ncbi:MAG TPA: nitrite/sulfite reductase [Anaeromyxobacter sp.]
MPPESPLRSPPRARPSFADAREVDDFVETLRRFERGDLDAEAWRAYRVVRGAYSQRQDGAHMLRAKLPQGIATADQLRALADVAARHSRGFGHVTTRQNFQLHFLSPADLEPALRRLAEAGVTTAGAGGNAVRNVTACPLAGVAPGEVFDPTPYAEALTRHFLRHPLASALPRKFKIAVEGCAEDHVGAAIQDLGLRAVVRDEGGRPRRGFAVTVAGGTSTACTSAAPFLDFLPAGDLLALAEAIVRVFHARGDRKNKQRNRLKFLVRDLGLEPFRALVEAELGAVRAAGAPALPFDPDGPPVEGPPTHGRPAPPTPEALAARARAAPPRGPGEPPEVPIDLAPTAAGLDLFRRTNVAPQRQHGFSVVTVAPPQGELTAPQLEALAELAVAYGEGAVRLASEGRLHLRWIADADVAPLHARLAAAGLARTGAGSAADVVSCPGAAACRLAVTRTRDLARVAGEAVRAQLGAAGLAAPIPVHVSGCPNGCSRHHVAAIGLQGSARRVGDRLAPQYVVLLGGGTSATGARFGLPAAKVPARRIPEAVARLAVLYVAERGPGEEAGPFFARRLDRARALLAPLEELSPGEAQADDFVEPGASEPFRPATQEGECAA